MATRSVATVFGGSGFLGRYVVKRLATAGHVIRVAVRDTEGALFLKPMGVVGQIVPLYASLTNAATVARAIDGADMVVNLVGILAEKQPGQFQALQADGAGAIAREAAKAGVGRLVHVSAIGADPQSPSGYGRTKGDGEAQVRAAYPAATILRPSIVFGPEDAFFNRFAGMAQMSPIMPVIEGATKFQPVYVGDVADAVMASLTRDDVQGKLFELGGPQVFTFRELLEWILLETHRNRRLVEIPPGLARFQASLMEKLPGKPFTRDQLLMLSRDNVVSPGSLGLADLGVSPTPIDLVVPNYLRRFRPGGGRRELYAA